AEEQPEGRAGLLRPRAAPRSDVSAGADRAGAAEVPARRAAGRARSGRTLQQGGGADGGIAVARAADRAQARRPRRRGRLRDAAAAALLGLARVPATAK